jgi:hypothetical protein
MNSVLEKSDFEEFWIRLYFNTKVDFIDAGINRAYRDFSRTQTGLSKVKQIDSYLKFNNQIRSIVEEVLQQEFLTQDDFDNWHKIQCVIIVNLYDEVYNNQFGLTFGQAQKWINMSLKYLFAFGENRVPGISRNYKIFHIPIDNIIQDKLQENYKIKKLDIA